MPHHRSVICSSCGTFLRARNSACGRCGAWTRQTKNGAILKALTVLTILVVGLYLLNSMDGLRAALSP